MELFFADVPIYRLLEKDYYEQRAKFVEERTWYPPQDRKLLEGFFARNPGQKTMREDRAEKDFGGPWNFNEVIGYIRMHFLGSQIRGELWFVDAERIIRTRKKTILYRTHKIVGERNFPRNATNEQIFGLILDYLASARKTKTLRGRVVDDSLLQRIGRYIDWRAMIDSHNQSIEERITSASADRARLRKVL